METNTNYMVKIIQQLQNNNTEMKKEISTLHQKLKRQDELITNLCEFFPNLSKNVSFFVRSSQEEERDSLQSSQSQKSIKGKKRKRNSQSEDLEKKKKRKISNEKRYQQAKINNFLPTKKKRIKIHNIKSTNIGFKRKNKSTRPGEVIDLTKEDNKQEQEQEFDVFGVFSNVSENQNQKKKHSQEKKLDKNEEKEIRTFFSQDNDVPEFNEVTGKRIKRTKRQLEELNGYDCPECRKFFELLELDPSVLNKCSRHRFSQEPKRPSTPEGYWNMDFFPSQVNNTQLL